MKTRIISYLATGACTLAWALPCAADLDSKMPEAAELPLYQDAVKNGDARGMNMLGKCYLNGVGVEEDVDKAIMYFRKGAALNDVACRHNMAVAYLQKEDYEEAMKHLAINAEAGFAYSQSLLGQLYLMTPQGKTDTAEAFRLLCAAYDKGCNDGCEELGVLYLGLHGILQDMDKAVELFRKAAEDDNGMAAIYLSCATVAGYDTGWSTKEAVIRFERLREQHHRLFSIMSEAYGTIELAPVADFEEFAEVFNRMAKYRDQSAVMDWCRLIQGFVLTHKAPLRDYYKRDMLVWLSPEAEAGNAEAWYLKGRIMCCGSGRECLALGTIAGDCCRRAAELGHPAGAYVYSEILEDSDREAAAQWMQKSADLGFGPAWETLADYHIYGEKGSPQNADEAENCYRKGIACKHVGSVFGLADFYRKRGKTQQACETWAAAVSFELSKEEREELEKRLTEYAEKGEPAAMVGLGNMMFQRDEADKAADLFLKAAQKGNAEAEARYSQCCFYGEGRERNLKEGEEWAKRAAEHGSAVGQAEYAAALLHGDNGPQRKEEAFQWFMKAAEQGYNKAQYEVAVCYLFGEGVEKDAQQTHIWLEKAAQNGHPGAMAALGEEYLNGKVVAQDKEKAFALFEKSAESGSPKGFYLLGECMLSGNGCTMDVQKGLQLIDHARRMGLEIAARRLSQVLNTLQESTQSADIYEYGIAQTEGNAMPQNEAEGRKHIERAAEQGFPMAQYTMAQYLSREEGQQDKVVQLLRKASAGGCGKAMWLLGMQSLREHRVQAARQWLEQAAAAGIEPAWEVLADLCGILKDEKGALPWHLKLAAKQPKRPDYLVSYHAAGMAYLLGKGVERDYVKAAEYLSAAAAYGHRLAQFNLGLMYLNGDGVGEPNEEKARYWLKLSACQGFERAAGVLQKMDSPRSSGAN